MTKQLFCCSDYLVDDQGFVLSKRGRPLKPSINRRGYQIINIMINGKRRGLSVHTAVARAFCDGYHPGLQVNHIDGNKRNNKAINLEWVTLKENVSHAIKELGFGKKEENNPNARAVVGKDKTSYKIVYCFPALIAAGRYFANGDEKRARHIQNTIYKVIRGNHGKKTYRDCVWEYIN